MSTPNSSASSAETYDIPERDVPPEEQPTSHGKFSFSEDWLATVAGLSILVLALLGLVPDIGEWF
ncbi:hypothetical protein [Nesterenkonia alba]|uniref:hypothetical protein n=1 Tax=Nesterenkonia alba TaxID=515814 RepID=UPI0003B70385|nr:hypothetical protein [Nesterenkonia alba]